MEDWVTHAMAILVILYLKSISRSIAILATAATAAAPKLYFWTRKNRPCGRPVVKDHEESVMPRLACACTHQSSSSSSYTTTTSCSRSIICVFLELLLLHQKPFAASCCQTWPFFVFFFLPVDMPFVYYYLVLVVAAAGRSSFVLYSVSRPSLRTCEARSLISYNSTALDSD